MLFGKYINKYYLKYGIFFLIGIAVLVFVDVIQLLIPQYLGTIVDELNGTGANINVELITRLVMYVIFVAAGMFVGRIIWRITIFHASTNIEAEIRQQMFLKAERLSQEYYHNNKVGTVAAWHLSMLRVIATVSSFLRLDCSPL